MNERDNPKSIPVETLLDKAFGGAGPLSQQRENDIRKFLDENFRAKADESHFEAYYDIERSWRELKRLYPVLADEILPESESSIMTLLNFLKLGQYPPPEVILQIAHCFESYMRAGGEKTLDMAFFGKEHKEKHSFAAIYMEKTASMFSDFDYSRILPLGNDSCAKSQESAAEDFLETMVDFHPELKGYSVESFLRQYRRWRNKHNLT